MKKHATKRIKNSTLIGWFFLFVFLAIVISIIVKLILLISQSTFDNHHQFILEVKEGNKQEKIIAFNPHGNTISILQVSGVKKSSDITALQIPIDAQFTLPKQTHASTLSSLLFTMLFYCHYPQCNNMNTVDVVKLYFFNKNVHAHALKTDHISIPSSQQVFNTIIPLLFTDTVIYKEGVSVAIINASGQIGLGNILSKLITNVGYNVISITTGDMQEHTIIQSNVNIPAYSLERLTKILHIKSQKMKKNGISDIIIFIGKQHPQL